MKTITELQAELQAVSAELETLSGELAQLQKSDSTKNLDLRHIEIVGQRYPMRSHHMKKQPAQFQAHYFAVLGRLLLLDCDCPENGWLFLQRLLTTAGCSVRLSGLQSNAGALTEEQLDSITQQVIQNGLQHAMLLDLMLVYLACAGREEARNHVVATAELLGSQPEEVKTLAALARAIAAQDDKASAKIVKGCTLDLGFVQQYLAEQP